MAPRYWLAPPPPDKIAAASSVSDLDIVCRMLRFPGHNRCLPQIARTVFNKLRFISPGIEVVKLADIPMDGSSNHNNAGTQQNP
ncbi:unnamed protein product [Colias eurytheme]|nr:unnamed protein product [Colias eurytheme]